MPMNTVIRPYRSPDHDMPEIKRVCCQAAFLGSPIDGIFNDTEWFADFIVAPYLIFEPECTWVAETDGAIVGYLTGSTGRFFEISRWRFVTAKVMELYWRYLLGRYRDHPRSGDFARFILTEALFHIPRHPANTPHFHFNVDEDYRGMGIGSRLIARFEETVKAKGMNSYYAEVISSQATRSEADFIRMGYTVFDKKTTTVFRREVGDLEVLCVVRDV